MSNLEKAMLIITILTTVVVETLIFTHVITADSNNSKVTIDYSDPMGIERMNRDFIIGF